MMKKGMLLLLCVALLLCGCGTRQEDSPASSYIWEAMPRLTYGSLEYEKLEVEAWYCGRCEATGNCKWAETELGYYFMYDSHLFYADKANMSNWVPVCNQPSCTHSKSWSYGQPVCNAEVDWNSFLMVDGRIYTQKYSYGHPELYSGKGECQLLCSRAPDGTDLRGEYHIEGTVCNGGGGAAYLLNYQYWLQCVTLLNPDGTYTLKLYLTSKDGDFLLKEFAMEEANYHTVRSDSIVEENINGMPVWVSGPNGDETFFTTVFGDEARVAYRFRDGTLEAPDIMAYATQWKYLSGDILRIFRADDGLYDVNIQTKEEVKVADLAGKAGLAVLLPNCMIAVGTDGTRELFDGQRWRSIQLPDDLQGGIPGVACVASDRILFLNNSEKECHIYQVMLDREELVMEFCGTIQKLPG